MYIYLYLDVYEVCLLDVGEERGVGRGRDEGRGREGMGREREL